jgi:hypothetical protein
MKYFLFFLLLTTAVYADPYQLPQYYYYNPIAIIPPLPDPPVTKSSMLNNKLSYKSFVEVIQGFWKGCKGIVDGQTREYNQYIVWLTWCKNDDSVMRHVELSGESIIVIKRLPKRKGRWREE